MALPAAAVASVFEAAGRGIGGAVQWAGMSKGAKAAQKQIEQGMAENQQMSDAERAQQTSYYQPYMTAGANATNELSDFRMREASPYQASTFSGVDMSEDPGVQYRMQQANAALDASAGAKGQLFSGAQQKALAELNQNLASQEYQNAYNRQYGQWSDAENAARDQYNTEADRMMNYDQYRMQQLQGLSGQGLSATSGLSGASQNIYGTQLGNQLMLRGEKADTSAQRAMAPYMAAGSLIGSAGSAGGDIAQSYMMNKGG